MKATDPKCKCERCGHRREEHYFEDLSEGAAFPCCNQCNRFVAPGTLAEVEAAERRELEDAVVKVLGHVRDRVAAWFEARRPRHRPRKK